MIETDAVAPTRVLIIDDDHLVRDFAVHTIEFGINREVMTYDSGFSAWEFINSRPDEVDIIIADANIPEMDGLELLERVKKKYPKKIYVLLAGDPATEIRARQLEADAFISKPFDAEVLFTVVQQFGCTHNASAKATVININSIFNVKRQKQ
jgi:CheY-like chemotaxis protein